MTTDKIARNMEVIGADGVHVGTVDGVANGRIRLAKRDSGEGQHKGHAHFIDLALVADVEGQSVRLAANGRSDNPDHAKHRAARAGDKACSRRMPHARPWADIERKRP